MSGPSFSTNDPFADGLPTFSGRKGYGRRRGRLPPEQRKNRVCIGVSVPEKIANRLSESAARRGIGAASMLQPLIPLLIAALDREAERAAQEQSAESARPAEAGE